MKSKILVRDKEATELQVSDRAEYKELLYATLHSKLDSLQHHAKTKEEIYPLLSDITELVNCLGTQHLTMRTKTASVARHTAYTKVNRDRGTERGGYFDGKYVEVEFE